MKIDYSSWKYRYLSIANLKLDVKNPRFSYQSRKDMNQSEIVRFLIDEYAVYELAKSIVVNGYLLNEEPIVCKEGDSYVVLEGNRRVAACKILLTPYKYLSPQRAKELSKYGTFDAKIKCYIAPTRRAADTLIYNKHTGIPLQKWDKISQDAFLITLLRGEQLSVEELARRLSVSASEIRKALRRYSIHQYCLKLFASDPYELEQIQEQGFPITNLERFYDDEKGLDFLGLKFGCDGDIIKRLPDEEFDKRLRFIVKQILSQDLTSRTFNNERDKDEYFSTIKEYDKELFNLDEPLIDLQDIPNNERHSATTLEDLKEPDRDGAHSTIKRSRRKSGLFADFNWGDTGIVKIDALFKSMQELNYKKHADVAGIVLRCFVDMLIYEFLKTKKKIGEVNKEDFVNTSAHNDRKYLELKKYITTTYAISDEEINDEELREHSRFVNKDNLFRIPELGNMIAYIIKHPELLDNNTRLIQVLDKFKKSNGRFIDLTSCNMFVHNQYFSANSNSLENCATDLSPVLDAMYSSIKK